MRPRAPILLPLAVLLAVGIAATLGPRLLGLTPYDFDGGGFGLADDHLGSAGLTPRVNALDDDLKAVLARGYAVLEAGLPDAFDLDRRQDVGEFGAHPGSPALETVTFEWTPLGRRNTLMPPNPRGERLYRVDVWLGGHVTGVGPPYAWIAFISRDEGDWLTSPYSLGEPIRTLEREPPAWLYRLQSATADALVDAIFVSASEPPTN